MAVGAHDSELYSYRVSESATTKEDVKEVKLAHLGFAPQRIVAHLSHDAIVYTWCARFRALPTLQLFNSLTPEVHAVAR